MPKVTEILRTYLAYEFIAVGIVWVVIAVALGLATLLWPALTCVVAGLLLRFEPSLRLTWPWANSSAILGLLVCSYQAYVATSYLGGVFSTIAIETLVAFSVFALVHLTMLYMEYSPAGRKAVPSK